jgi:hypothetical protein
MKSLRTQLLTAALCGVIAFGLSQKARAQNLVQNGNFASTTPFSYMGLYATGDSSASGQLGINIMATGWSDPTIGTFSGITYFGYNFLYKQGSLAGPPGSADVLNTLDYKGNSVMLWGPNNGGLTPSGGALYGLPPGETNGNFVAADGAYQPGAIQQTITGLTPGQIYAVSFYWAAAQQEGFYTATTEKWLVDLSTVPDDLDDFATAQSTTNLDNPSQMVTDWIPQTFDFTATSNSEVLSFLAAGTPSGVPPYSLLTDVSMQQVPEATTVLLVALFAPAMGFAAWRRQRRQRRQ